MRSKGVSSATAAFVILVLVLSAVTAVYVDTSQGNSDQISSLQSVISNLTRASSTLSNGGSGALPVMNQAPTVRTIRETWYLSPSAHQDRFDPSFIVVNQGDTVHMTLIDNDTVAHDFVLGPPYNIVMNVTVPGLVNDLTRQIFTTNATNNTPGVAVHGTPGNVSATYSFLAAYSGIYEFVCTYHVEVGMFGYLVILPNAAYKPTSTTATTVSTTVAGTIAHVAIAQGAGANVTNKGFAPNTITVVIGVNNTVLWTNNDNSPHTVTANDGSFMSDYLPQGGTFVWTFPQPGTYEYHCQIHPWMTGVVIVKAQH